MPSRPSLKGGYARDASESANPSLWEGLLYAWMPELGPTGRGTGPLLDYGPYKRHYTFQAAEPIEWATGPNGYVIDTDATNFTDLYVDVPELGGPGFNEHGVSFTNVFHNKDAPNWNQIWGPEFATATGDSYVCLGTNQSGYLNVWHGGNKIGAAVDRTREWITGTVWTDGNLTIGNQIETWVNGEPYPDLTGNGFWQSHWDATDYTVEFAWKGMNGWAGCTIVHKRKLEPREITLLHRDPLAPFYRRKRKSWLITAAPPAADRTQQILQAVL